MTSNISDWTEQNLAGFLAALDQASHEIVSEHNLRQRLQDDLTLLHEYRQSRPQHFNPSRDQHCQKLTDLQNFLEEFIEVQEDMQIIVSRDDYDDAMERLDALARALSGRAVEKRVARERRQLQTQLPRLRQAEASRVKNQVEKAAPKCRKGHAMNLRQAEHGWFWGCSRYPKCSAIKQLTNEQETALRLSHS